MRIYVLRPDVNFTVVRSGRSCCNGDGANVVKARPYVVCTLLLLRIVIAVALWSARRVVDGSSAVKTLSMPVEWKKNKTRFEKDRRKPGVQTRELNPLSTGGVFVRGNVCFSIRFSDNGRVRERPASGGVYKPRRGRRALSHFSGIGIFHLSIDVVGEAPFFRRYHHISVFNDFFHLITGRGGRCFRKHTVHKRMRVKNISYLFKSFFFYTLRIRNYFIYNCSTTSFLHFTSIQKDRTTRYICTYKFTCKLVYKLLFLQKIPLACSSLRFFSCPKIFYIFLSTQVATFLQYIASGLYIAYAKTVKINLFVCPLQQ